MFHKFTVKQTFENSKLCDAEFADPCAPPSLLAWLSIQSPCRSADDKFRSRVSACDSRPLVSWCLWQIEYHVCFGSVCTPNKLAAVLPLGTWALLPHPSTDSDRCADTTTIRDQRTVRKLTLNPTSFLGIFFFDRMIVSGCLVSSRSKFSSCLVARRDWAWIDWIPDTTTTTTICKFLKPKSIWYCRRISQVNLKGGGFLWQEEMVR